MKLTIDFETRSRINLKTQGMYRYAEDDSTDVMCIAVKPADGATALWIPEKFEHLIAEEVGPRLNCDENLANLIARADIIEAHNAGFERAIWKYVMSRYGFADIPLDKWRCSAAKCAAMGLPRALSKAAIALNLDQNKDAEGYKVMMKMCKPLPSNRIKAGQWSEEPEDYAKLCRYCAQDVEVEHALSSCLPDLVGPELDLWQVDQRINDRGVRVDVKAIEAILERLDEAKKNLKAEAIKIAGITPTQVEKTIQWLDGKGVKVEDLRKDTVIEVLNRDTIDEETRRFLQIRQALGKASASKATAMRKRAMSDDRVRGEFVFCGAERTGRWAGGGIQLHNMPRKCDPQGPTAFQIFGVDDLAAIYGDVFNGVSQCIRPLLFAAQGKTFICSDFKAIEGRVLAWHAAEEYVLQAYRDGLDTYKVAAQSVYAMDYDDIGDKSDERQVGKVIELACGYQGWLGAFQSMAANYGLELDDDTVKDAVGKWRNNRPRTTAFWYGLNDAAIKAIKTGRPHAYKRVKFGVRSRFLHMRLPSGRLLSYCDPRVEDTVDLFGRQKETITFMGIDHRQGSRTQNKWTRLSTYGGKLTENCIQATARDLLAEAMVRLDRAGFNLMLHVHDEAMAEELEGCEREEEFNEIMKVVPEWADGLPIDVSGWTGHRYRKD